MPNLANEYFLVSGTGRYMRNVILKPEDNICIAKIDDKGENYAIVWGLEKGGRPTSEFPTHLMNHSIKKRPNKWSKSCKFIMLIQQTSLLLLSFYH